MRPWVQLAGRLYPNAWRARYGEEFDALLEDIPATWRQGIDVVTQAVTLQIADKRSYVLLIGAVAIAGALVAAAVQYAAPQPYVAWTIVEASAGQFPVLPVSEQELGLDANDRLRQIRAQILSRETLEPLIDDLALYPDELEKRPLEDVLGTMRADIGTLVLRHKSLGNDDRQGLMISYAYPDPQRAQAVIEALVTEAGKANLAGNVDQEQKWRAHFMGNVPDPPGVSLGLLGIDTMAPRPRWSSTLSHGAFGFLCGSALGLLAALMRRWPRPMLRAGAFACAGCVLAAGIGYLAMGEYTSTAAVALTGPVVPDGLPEPPPSELVGKLAQDAFSPESLARIAGNPNLRRLKGMPFDRAMNEVRDHLVVTPLGPPEAAADSGLKIRYRGADPRETQWITGAVVEGIVATFAEQERSRCRAATSAEPCQVRELKLGSSMTVVTNPTMPEEAHYPLGALGAGGAALGLISLAMMRLRWHPKLVLA